MCGAQTKSPTSCGSTASPCRPSRSFRSRWTLHLLTCRRDSREESNFVGRGGVVITPLLIITIGVGGVSSIDWFRFYKSLQGQTISLPKAKDHAMRVVASRLTNHQLVMADPCIDARIFKVVTGVPVAYYNVGLAWPARYKQFNVVLTTLASGVLKLSELRAAGIGSMVTDGSCKAGWAKHFSKLLTRTAASRSGPSPSDVIRLWRLKTNKNAH